MTIEDKNFIIDKIENSFLSHGVNRLSDFHFTLPLSNGYSPNHVLFSQDALFYHIAYNDKKNEYIIEYSEKTEGPYEILRKITDHSEFDKIDEIVHDVLNGWTPKQEKILRKYIDISLPSRELYDTFTVTLFSMTNPFLWHNAWKNDEKITFDRDIDPIITARWDQISSLDREANKEQYQNSLLNLYNECCEILGENHSNSMYILTDLSDMLVERHAIHLALYADMKLYRYMENEFGRTQKSTLYQLLSVIWDLTAIEEYDDAIILVHYLVNQVRDQYGEEDDLYLSALYEKGRVLYEYGRDGLALENITQCYEKAVVQKGKTALLSIQCLKLLAQIHRRESIHEYQKALEEDLEAFALDRLTSKPRLEDQIFDYIALSEDYLCLEEISLSDKFLMSALSLSKSVHGENHLNTLVILNDYLFFLSKNEKERDYEFECELSEKIYNGIRNLLGEEHPITMDAEYNYIMALGAFDPNAAINECIKTISKWENLLGPDHYRLMAINSLLRSLLNQQKT